MSDWEKFYFCPGCGCRAGYDLELCPCPKCGKDNDWHDDLKTRIGKYVWIPTWLDWFKTKLVFKPEE